MSNEKIFYLGLKAVIRNTEGKVLILKHSKGYWDFPGGRVNNDEDVDEALLREVMEETGIQNLAEIIPYKMSHTKYQIPFQDRNAGLILWYHNCQMKGNSVIKLSDEHTEYKWVDQSEAMDLIVA